MLAEGLLTIHLTVAMAATPEQAPAKVEKPMNPLAKLYVILYNAACCAGWALLLFKVVSFLQANKWTFGDSAALYKDIEQPLKLVQTAAILEIVHAATGLVRSNVMTAFMQGEPDKGQGAGRRKSGGVDKRKHAWVGEKGLSSLHLAAN